MRPHHSRLEFANTLRGIACMAVLLAHYIFVFESIHGEYDGFSKLAGPIYPKWLISALHIPGFGLGPFGVALFFLISGLVIPMSVDAMSRGPMPRTAFLIARACRIVPTYATGAAISIAALTCAARYNGHLSFSIDARTYFTNISLFRDWFGSPQFDGVIWTLEVESKFYLTVLLFWILLCRRSLIPIVSFAIATILVAPLKAKYPLSWSPPENFVWNLKYLAYMYIGVAFNYHYREAISDLRLKLIVIGVTVVFLSVWFFEGAPAEFPVCYAISVALFSWLYARRRDWSGGPVLRFLARISFPLYAVHAPIGYVLLRILIGNGWTGLEAFAIVTPCVIFIAWLIHFLIEAPTQSAGKWLAAKCQSLASRHSSTVIENH